MRALAAAALILACATCVTGAAAPTTPSESVVNLLRKDLTDVPGKEVRMLTVEYAPGASSAPHRHNAQVFVYVLSGSLRMQVEGSPAVMLGPGQTFYEGRDDVHAVSENASRTEPAKFLVFMVKDRASP